MNETGVSSGENVPIGVIYVTASAICILAYIPCLWVMKTGDSLKDKPCFKIMFHLGLSDMIQLICHLAGGFVTFFQVELQYGVNKAFGGMINAAWMTYLPLSTLMGFDRVVHICYPQVARKICGKASLNFGLCVCWLYGVIWYCIYLSPYVTFLHVTSVYIFYYDEAPYANLAQAWEYWQSIILLALIGISFIAILIWIRVKGRQSGSRNSQAQKRERAVLLQAILICAGVFLAITFWNFAPNYLPEDPYTYCSFNLVWIAINGINPIIYLTLNKTVRKEVRKALGGKNLIIPDSTTGTRSATVRRKPTVGQ